MVFDHDTKSLESLINERRRCTAVYTVNLSGKRTELYKQCVRYSLELMVHQLFLFYSNIE